MNRKLNSSSMTVMQRAILWLPLVFLIVFYVLPLFIMVVYSFWEIDFYGNLQPVWNLNQYKTFFDTPVYGQLLFKSLYTAAINCLMCLIIPAF